MLVRVGSLFVDPMSVTGVVVMDDGDGGEVILIAMQDMHHAFPHRDWSGSAGAEAMRIAELINSSVDLMVNRTESVDDRFREDGVDMIRLPAAEYEDRVNSSYRSGWDDASRGSVSDRKKTLYDRALVDVCNIIYERSQNMSYERFMEFMSEELKKSYNKIASDLGGRIEWQA